MRTKSSFGGRRKLQRDRDPPTPSSISTLTAFPRTMIISQKCNMLEASEKEVVEDKGWLKKDGCIRCDERGSLLICNVSGCPVAVHENCISCKPTFDDQGNFYCPYCSYKRALIHAHKLKKKAMAAKKALSSFIGSSAPTGNNSDKKKDGESEEEQTLHEELNGKKTKSGMVEDDDGWHRQPHPCAADDSDTDITEPDTEAAKDVDVDVDVDGILDKMRLSPNTDFGETPLKQKRRLKIKACKIGKLQNSGLPRGSPYAFNEEIDKDAANKTKDVCYSLTSKGSPESAKKLTSSFSNTKRRRVQWTTEEEELLGEGVHKFSSSVNKNLPWRKILEFGSHVFDATRSPVDLKDKWRTMQARHSSTKQ